jgi:uncharacterized repeat protein (TIGR01451 family)
VLLATGLVLALGLLVQVPLVAAASTTITSTGPLNKIAISSELNCAVNHIGDTLGEFYDDIACATEIAVGGGIYGPSSIPANNNTLLAYTAVSQSAVTGSGTSAHPYKLVTVVDVGTTVALGHPPTGLRITETDTYVVGQESYRTDVQVANRGTAAKTAILYRGGDCYLQNSDYGWGKVGSPAGAVACLAGTSSTPGTRIEQWVPLTAGSRYFEAGYSTVWDAMSAKIPFPNTCECGTYEDNGAGLSWSLAIPAGGSRTVSHLTNFSPLGNLALSTTKTADQATVSAGAQDGYTITVSNPNAVVVHLVSISDTLAAGFSYVTGSTTGVTTTNPTVSAQTLTWTGPFTVPAASGSTPGHVTLHFKVKVSSTPGVYYDNATADGGSFTVVATGATAPITVTAPLPTPTPSPSRSPSPSASPRPSASTSPSASPTPTPTASPSPTRTASPSPTPRQTATLPPTSTASNGSSNNSTPLFALLICLALGCLGLAAAQAQRRGVRR